MKVLANNRQMKSWDTCTIEHFKVPAMVLMERAALSVVEEIEKRNLVTGKCLVVCGVGNNGGDGLAIARMLYQKGCDVTVVCKIENEKVSEQTKHQYEILKQYGVAIVPEIPEDDYDLILDGIFGIGLSREIEGTWAKNIDRLNKKDGYKIAIDIPSGVNGDNGKVMGCAFRADLSVTFAYMKPGLLLYPGYVYAGEVVVKEIGIDENSFLDEQPTGFMYENSDTNMLPKRRTYSNKGTFGKVLVVAGKCKMAGASYFSGKAAAVTGCGLVKNFTAEENRTILQQLMPEAILETFTDAENSREENKKKLEECLNWADVVVVGPGLGTQDTSQYLIKNVIELAKIPMVVDADALNIIAQMPEILTKRKAPVIVTPHIGEMARLTGKTIEEIKNNLITVAGKYAKEYNVICVLKDARTVTALPDGKYFINVSGNQGMATAGSGDVLTGVLAGLIAQGMEVEEAAPFGVFLHGMAGDVAVKKTGYYSMMASDIIEGVKEITRKETDHE